MTKKTSLDSLSPSMICWPLLKTHQRQRRSPPHLVRKAGEEGHLLEAMLGIRSHRDLQS
jgi:hypothetical protein